MRSYRRNSPESAARIVRAWQGVPAEAPAQSAAQPAAPAAVFQ